MLITRCKFLFNIIILHQYNDNPYSLLYTSNTSSRGSNRTLINTGSFSLFHWLRVGKPIMLTHCYIIIYAQFMKSSSLPPVNKKRKHVIPLFLDQSTACDSRFPAFPLANNNTGGYHSKLTTRIVYLDNISILFNEYFKSIIIPLIYFLKSALNTFNSTPIYR